MKMKKTSGEKKGLSLYLWYGIFFMIAAIMCFSFFMLYDKSMVWGNDGLYQHYNAFVYFGEWARSIVKEFMAGHGFVIPLWEWGFGSGKDIVGSTVLTYDLFYVFSVFFPQKYAEIGYTFTIILRLFLIGFAFSAYCKKMGCAKWTTVCAALMYTFCAFTIYTAPRHPYFINYMIFLPLIFLGVEKMLKNESFIVFSIGVALAALPYFYFFYMIVILTVLYVVVRLLSTPGYRKPRMIAGNILKLFGAALLGVMAAAVVLLPSVLDFIQNNTRISDTYIHSFLYSINAYSALPGSFVGSTISPMNWAFVGIAPLAYIGMGGAIINDDKEQRFARMYLLAEIIFLVFPVFGKLFNGGGYVTNRWVFAWPFMPTYLFAKEFPNILKFDNRQKIHLYMGCGVYTLLCLVLNRSRVESNLVGLVLLLLSLVFICSIPLIKSLPINFAARKIIIPKKRIVQSAIFLMMFLEIYNIAYYRYSKNEGNYLEEFRDAEALNVLLFNERAAVWKLIKDKDFYRIDNANMNWRQKNFPAALKQSTTANYWSLNSAEDVNWRRLNSVYSDTNYDVSGLYARAWLEPLFCAKYFVTDSSEAERAAVPYGYVLQGTKNGYSDEYYLYKSDNILPFGYTYDSVMSKAEFENLSIVERQQAALQSCVIDDDAEVNINTATNEYDDYNVEYWESVSMKDKTLHVESEDSEVTLTFDAGVNGELYVLISGFRYENGNDSTTITANCGDMTAFAYHYTERNIYSEGRTEYLLNLGYSDKERNTITLKFSNMGDYSFESLKVVCQPMGKLSEYVRARSEDILENVEFQTNRVSGVIDLDEPKFLCMSLPYSKGWTAYVDGQKVELLRANIAFSGLELGAGYHEIELKFCTPYIKIGAMLSIVGILGIVGCGNFCGLLSLKHTKRKKNDTGREDMVI